MPKIMPTIYSLMASPYAPVAFASMAPWGRELIYPSAPALCSCKNSRTVELEIKCAGGFPIIIFEFSIIWRCSSVKGPLSRKYNLFSPAASSNSNFSFSSRLRRHDIVFKPFTSLYNLSDSTCCHNYSPKHRVMQKLYMGWTGHILIVR